MTPACVYSEREMNVRKVWQREKRIRLSLPMYSLGEEIFSAVSHGVTALYDVER